MDCLQNWVESYEEDHWGKCIPMEDSSFDLEVLGTPVLGGYICYELGVRPTNIIIGDPDVR